MNDVLSLLHTRNSAPKLTGPGPSDAELEQMLLAALRAPDHARLRPWRFLTVRDQRREDLGKLFLKSLLKRNPVADEAARAKARSSALRTRVCSARCCSISCTLLAGRWC